MGDQIHDDEPDTSEAVVQALLAAECPRSEHAIGGVLYCTLRDHALGDVMSATLERILDDE